VNAKSGPNPPLVFDQNLGSAGGKNKDFTRCRAELVAAFRGAQALGNAGAAAFRRN
jgi:hypothetical protein